MRSLLHIILVKSFDKDIWNARGGSHYLNSKRLPGSEPMDWTLCNNKRPPAQYLSEEAPGHLTKHVIGILVYICQDTTKVITWEL
jgi:hypothetical protein